MRRLYPTGPVRYHIRLAAGPTLSEALSEVPPESRGVLAALRRIDRDRKLARELQKAGLLELKIGRGPFPMLEVGAGRIADLAEKHGYFLAGGTAWYYVQELGEWRRPSRLPEDPTVQRARIEGTLTQ